MPKYWGRNYFTHTGVSQTGSKAKDGGKKEEKERERLKVGNNNGQLRIENVTSGGTRKPPGPIFLIKVPNLVRTLFESNNPISYMYYSC